MNPMDLFFEGGEAIMVIFKLGFIPKEEDFREFSEDDDETLRYVASVMPYPFSKGSKYEEYGGGRPKQ